jgi:broad specificity phosphatase PhoE
VLAAARSCEPFAAELVEHLQSQPALGAAPSVGVLQGRQALVFGAGSNVVKYVGRQHTERKPAPKQRVFVDSLRREVEFYRSMQTAAATDAGAQGIAALFPRVSLALATGHDAGCAECEAFCLVMDDLGPGSLAQAAALSETSAAAVLAALATLHAHHWGDAAVLAGERGGYWGLERRPSAELDADAAQRQWASVVAAFGGRARDLPPMLGRDLALAARRLDAVVQETAVTMIHGDPKPFNVFVEQHDPGDSAGAAGLLARLIDMSWCGRGNPLSDVAYVLAAALDVSLLMRGESEGTDGEAAGGAGCASAAGSAAAAVEADDAAAEAAVGRLLAGYEQSLLPRLSAEKQADYHARIRPSFEWCFVDYARVAVLSLWKAATPAAMVENARKHGLSMVNQSPRHLEWIARRAGRVLARLPDRLNLSAVPGPAELDKLVYLIRHGEAGHNSRFADASAAAAAGDAQASHALKALGYDVHDGVLTAAGEASARQLGLALSATTLAAAAVAGDLLLVSSPMRRAMQTAQLAFPPLAAAAAAGGAGAVARVVVVRQHRERDGGLGRRCDSGTLRSELEPQFAPRAGAGEPAAHHNHTAGQGRIAFDFGDLPERWCLRHEQLLARAGRDIGPVTAAMVAAGAQNAWRESEAALDTRVREFAAWLGAQPQRTIAVVGHGDFWRAFAGRIFGRAVRLPNCGWAAFEGPLGPGGVLTLGPGAAVVNQS